MKSFTWVNSLAKKAISFVLLFIFVFSGRIEQLYAVERVANVTKENCDNLKIRNIAQNNDEIGSFTIEIKDETVRLTDRGLEFNVKIVPTIGTTVKYENEEVRNTEDGRIFSVCIGREALTNKPFHKILKFSSNNPNLIFDEAKLLIEPIIELRIESGRVVDFGKILCGVDGSVQSMVFPEVRFSYSVLKDTTCKIESKNGFRLKHQDKNEFIPYVPEIRNAELRDLNEKEKEFYVNAHQKEFSARFKVNTFVQHVPSSGDWKDIVIFSIVCDK